MRFNGDPTIGVLAVAHGPRGRTTLLDDHVHRLLRYQSLLGQHATHDGDGSVVRGEQRMPALQLGMRCSRLRPSRWAGTARRGRRGCHRGSTGPPDYRGSYPASPPALKPIALTAPGAKKLGGSFLSFSTARNPVPGRFCNLRAGDGQGRPVVAHRLSAVLHAPVNRSWRTCGYKLRGHLRAAQWGPAGSWRWFRLWSSACRRQGNRPI